MLYKQISIKFSSVVCFLMGILVLAALLWGNNGQGAAVAQWVQPGADELSSSLSQVVRTDADADKANAYTLMTCTPLTDPAQIPSPTHIDFDELADGFVIGDHYQALRGVSFEDSQTQRTEATFSVLAHSRFNVAMNQPVPPHVSNNSPMLIQFDSPRTHVGFYVGNSGGGDFTAIVRAYNVDGQELCFYDMEPVPDDHTLFMGIFDTTGSISSVTLDYGDTAIIESIDDLYFSAAPLPPTATATATSTATAPPTNTPTPTATPTATTPPTPTNTPTPTATPTPITDLVADELEITQGIQNLDNEVFLVAGKRTFVRFYVHSTGGNHLTIARLKLQKGNQSTTVYPIAPGGPYLKVRPSHLRLLPGHAFLFELPKDFREGLVSIKAEVNFTTPVWRPTPNPYETNYNNNSISKLVWFEPMPTVPVVIARQPYRPKNSPGDYYSSTFYDEWMLFSWLKRAYPVNTVQLYLRTLPLIQNATRKWIPDTNDPSIGGYALTYPNCDSVNAYLYVNKSAVINSWFYHKNIHLVGIVSDEYGFMRGCAWGGVASGPSGSGTWGWDFDGTYADWYGAHELAHTYNRPHTLGELPNGCGEKDTVQQYTNGYISPISDLFERKAMYGFDPYFLKVAPYHNPILGPVWHDVMTYCDKQWVSDITYTGLRDYLKTLYTLPNGLVAHSAQTSITDRLAVFGSINMQTGELATLLPMSVWFNADDIEPRIPGAYAIVLLDADQNELARYPFTPDMGEGGSSPLDDVEVAYAGISELVPYVADTTHVNIEGPGGR